MQAVREIKHFKKTERLVNEFEKMLMDNGTQPRKLQEGNAKLEEIKEVFYAEKIAAARKSEKLYKAYSIFRKISDNALDGIASKIIIAGGYIACGASLVASVYNYLSRDIANFSSMFKVSVIFAVAASVYFMLAKSVEKIFRGISLKYNAESYIILNEIEEMERRIELASKNKIEK